MQITRIPDNNSTINKKLKTFVKILILSFAAFIIGMPLCARNSGRASGHKRMILATDTVGRRDVKSLKDSVLTGDTITLKDSLPTDSLTRTDSIARKTPRIPRKSSPVEVDDNKPREVLHYFDKHGNALEEPVRFLAVLDTVTKPKSKPVYPLYNGWTLGANFADAIMMAAGQKYGSFDVWADVSLLNWFFPVVEAGVGFASNTPENGNYAYKAKPSFYAKIGMNYNFMYKSDPAYHIFAGFRVGFSSFKYDLDNVSISDGYWDQTQQFSMKGLKASALYGEFLVGIKVKIAGPFSLGWTARYHAKFKVNSKTSSTPWYIPGYGANSPFGFSLSAMWVFGQKEIKQEDTSKK